MEHFFIYYNILNTNLVPNGMEKSSNSEIYISFITVEFTKLAKKLNFNL